MPCFLSNLCHFFQVHGQDLRGKIIGVPFGSTTHYQLLYLLEKIVKMPDVRVVDVKPSSLEASWLAGDIDGYTAPTAPTCCLLAPDHTWFLPIHIYVVDTCGVRTFIWPPYLFSLQEEPFNGSLWVHSGFVAERGQMIFSHQLFVMMFSIGHRYDMPTATAACHMRSIMLAHALTTLGAPTWTALVHRQSSASPAFIRDLLRTLDACNNDYHANGWSFTSKQVHLA